MFILCEYCLDFGVYHVEFFHNLGVLNGFQFEERIKKLTIPKLVETTQAILDKAKAVNNSKSFYYEPKEELLYVVLALYQLNPLMSYTWVHKVPLIKIKAAPDVFSKIPPPSVKYSQSNYPPFKSLK